LRYEIILEVSQIAQWELYIRKMTPFRKQNILIYIIIITSFNYSRSKGVSKGNTDVMWTVSNIHAQYSVRN